MQIVIEVQRWEPPEGTIFLRAESTPDRLLTSPFEGWLSLVGRLYDLFGRAALPRDMDGRPG